MLNDLPYTDATSIKTILPSHRAPLHACEQGKVAVTEMTRLEPVIPQLHQKQNINPNSKATFPDMERIGIIGSNKEKLLDEKT